MGKKAGSGENFFQHIIASLFRSSDPEAEKKRQLKAIAKDLSRCKYKFYKFSSDEALPAMGKFFYELYKALGPAQTMFQSIQNPNAFKNMVIEYSLNDNQRQIMDRLTADNIKALAKKMPVKELSEQVKNDILLFTKEFDIEMINKIDRLYTKMTAFRAVCMFDYYFLLKKFDSNLHEHDFAYIPRFETIRAEYVADDLKDFTAAAWSLPEKESWNDVMGVFKLMKGVEPVAAGIWSKIIARLADLKNSSALEMIIRLIAKDPSYTPMITRTQEHIIEPQLDKIKMQAETVIKKIELEQKNSKVEQLLTVIFGTTAVIKLKNYSESGNLVFTKKMIAGFTMHQPLNYLKAFLLDYFKKNVREFADLILVRGKWTTAALSGQMSDSYHAILSISEEITAFDTSLAEDAELGIKLRNMLLKSDHDKEANRILHSMLKEINEKATFFVTNGSQELITFARHVKSVLEDREKPAPALIINWKELDHFAEEPVKESGIAIYKMIFQFITLMQFYIKKEK